MIYDKVEFFENSSLNKIQSIQNFLIYCALYKAFSTSQTPTQHIVVTAKGPNLQQIP